MQATVRAPVLIDAVIPRDWAETRVKQVALDVGLIVGFAWFVALSAQIAVLLPWTTVPITGQTFAVLVTGGTLGAWRGSSALVIYMAMGMIIPVFAPSGVALGLQGEWDVHFIFPWEGTESSPFDITGGGYIVGFIFAAYLTGWLAERAWDRKPWAILGLLGGNAVLYIPGLLWLFYLINTDWIHPVANVPLGELIAGDGDWDKTLKGGLYPFIAGDLTKLYLASLTLPTAWALVDRLRSRFRGGGEEDGRV